MKVEILSRKLITPSSPTPPHLQYLKISSFDQISPPVYVQCIFYYPSSGEENGVINNTERSDRLQKSLSETLTLFYPLAGRYIKDKFLIDCNDKGAEYLEAQVSGCGSLSQLLRDGELETGLQNHLVPYAFLPEKSPLVIIQFNMFECGGLAVGVCVSHRIADAYTVFRFINSWGIACRIGIDKVHCPSFGLASFCPPKDISAIKVLPLRKGGDKKIVTKRFVFDGPTISNLKAIVCGSTLQKHRPTRVEVVTGLLWKTLLQVSRVRHGSLRPSFMTHTINMRGRTTLSLQENSCGNFAGMMIALFTPDNDCNVVCLHDLVGRIHDSIMSTGYKKASNGDELFDMTINVLKEMNEELDKDDDEIDVFNFTSWCWFPIYEADFGWGRPDWANSVSMIVENIGLLMDTKDGEGIEAWVALDEDAMLLLEQDSDIRRFCSS